jgi:hypothetical protein
LGAEVLLLPLALNARSGKVEEDPRPAPAPAESEEKTPPTILTLAARALFHRLV